MMSNTILLKMIKYDSKDVVSKYRGKKVISAVYLGLRLIWETINSCFGKGCWFNDKPWSNVDGWNN